MMDCENQNVMLALKLGLRANVIILTPPLVITAEEVTQICQALSESIAQIDQKSLRLPD